MKAIRVPLSSKIAQLEINVADDTKNAAAKLRLQIENRLQRGCDGCICVV
jgi:hypothetical protein